jgi:hypothetical protein
VPHASSSLEQPLASRSPFEPPQRDAPALSVAPAFSAIPDESRAGVCSPHRTRSPTPCPPPTGPCEGPAIIPIHNVPTTQSMSTMNVAHAFRILLACINICVAMLGLHTTETDVSEAYFAHRKKLKRRERDDVCVSPLHVMARHDPEDKTLEHPHMKQVFSPFILTHWDLNARWYVKPKSTCWFEEYLFNIYTPDMFYDILRMRRRTFDRLVNDLRPYIQGQHTIGDN